MSVHLLHKFKGYDAQKMQPKSDTAMAHVKSFAKSQNMIYQAFSLKILMFLYDPITITHD